MIYCFDIDGTLCSDTDGNYPNAQPFPDVIAEINRLYTDGHQIVLYTARGSTTEIDWRELTEHQVKEWGIQYHALFMGKPTADIYIDDKAVSLKEWKRDGFRTGPLPTAAKEWEEKDK